MKWITGLLLVLACFLNVNAEELPFTQFQLKNGMAVYFKTLPLDDHEVSIQLAFKNGFATFAGAAPAAYKIAPDMAVNSEASTLFDGQDDAIDFYYSVEPLYSYWILDTNAAHLKKAITGLQKLINAPVWNESLLRTAQQNLQGEISSEENQLKALYQLNGIPTDLFIPTIKSTLPTLTLKEIAQAYRNLFLDPQHAVLVIAGNFNEDEVKKMVVDIFSTIPQLKERVPLNHIPPLKFPTTSKESAFDLKKRTDPQITLTLPLPYALTADNFVETELLALALEESFKTQQTLKNSSSIDIALELPLYPLLESPWIVITYQSEAQRYRDDALQLIKTTQEHLQKGIDQIVLSKAVEQMQISDSYWKNEPEYWLAFLGNQALMGLSPEETLMKRQQASSISLETINKDFKQFQPDHYTLFFSSSEEF